MHNNSSSRMMILLAERLVLGAWYFWLNSPVNLCFFKVLCEQSRVVSAMQGLLSIVPQITEYYTNEARCVPNIK